MADGNPLPVPTGAAKTPSDFLKSIKGKPVLVKLNSGVDYRGMKGLGAVSTSHKQVLTLPGAGMATAISSWSSTCFFSGHMKHYLSKKMLYCCCCAGILACLDGYMNIAMEHTEVRFAVAANWSAGAPFGMAVHATQLSCIPGKGAIRCDCNWLDEAVGPVSCRSMPGRGVIMFFAVCSLHRSMSMGS